MLPFNPDYSVKGCSDSEIVFLDEFQTILEYPNQIKPIFEDGSVKVRVSGSACRTYNAKVTVSFDIDENGNLVNYKTLRHHLAGWLIEQLKERFIGAK